MKLCIFRLVGEEYAQKLPRRAYFIHNATIYFAKANWSEYVFCPPRSTYKLHTYRKIITWQIENKTNALHFDGGKKCLVRKGKWGEFGMEKKNRREYEG